MVISRITAITSGGRVKPVIRVGAVVREVNVAPEPETEMFDEVVLARKDSRSGRSRKGLIAADRPPAARSSLAVQEQLSKLKLGG